MLASGFDPVRQSGCSTMLDIDEAVFFTFTGANSNSSGGLVEVLDFDRDDFASSDAGSVHYGDHGGVSASAIARVSNASFDKGSKLDFRKSPACR